MPSVKSCLVSHYDCISFSHRLCVLPTHIHNASLAHSVAQSQSHSFTASVTASRLTNSLPLFLPASAGRQRPTEAKVAAIVAKEEWKTNVPSLPDVLQAWVSPLKAAIEDDKGVLKSVVEQRWKGIDFIFFGCAKRIRTAAYVVPR